MKRKVGRMQTVVSLGVAFLGLPPLSCSSQKTTEAAQANERGLSHAKKGEY